MFSSDIKIISVASKTTDGGCNRDLLSSLSSPSTTSSLSSFSSFKQIKAQYSSNNDQKFCGNNTTNNSYTYNKHHGKYNSHHNKPNAGGNNKGHNNNNKHIKKANKYHISNCGRIILNNNNNSSSKNQNLNNSKFKSIAANNNNNTSSINNNIILDNNNINVNVTKIKLTSPPSKASFTKINDYLITCSTRQTERDEPDSMVMNNTPKTIQAIASVTTSSAGQPTVTSPTASYSLDFLHSVGVQMTSCTDRAYLPCSSPARHGNQFVNLSGQQYSGGYSGLEENQPIVNSVTETANLNVNNSKSNYKDYGNFNSTVGYNGNSRNIAIPTSPSYSYRNAYGYQPVQSFHNRNYGGQMPMQYSMGGDVSGMNNGYSQRNQANPKKSWNNFNQSNMKKCCNMSMNKYAGASNNNLNSPQSAARTRNQQNLRSLTYVPSDSGRIVGNSRSPTPSPKSESPSLFKTSQNLLPDYNSNGMHANLNADQANSSHLTSSSGAPSIDMNSTNGAMNGYESDSSHSSYRHNDLTYRPSSKALSVSPNYHLNEMPPLVNLNTLSEDGLKNHAHYYGSHHNLTFWNSTMSANYSPNSMYSNSGSGSSEGGSQYLGDGSFPQKRSQSSHSRSYRGRRSIYPNFRAHTFHENMFTPPDRFLARAHLVEIKEAPEQLLIGSKWDSMSQSIWNKFIMSQQREDTYRRKMYLWRYLYVTIKKAHPRYGLYLVGSTISGFGADTSDVDMCLVSRTNTGMDARMESVMNLNRLKDYLESTGVFEQFNLIEAKVPILRFRDAMHNLEVDLNFNNCVGIRNTHLLHCYSQLDWRLRPLVLVTKLWAQYHDINNAKNMTISSYSLALMVIHFLQYAVEPPVLPCLHEMYPEKFHILLMSNDFGFVDMNEEIGPYPSRNTQTLGELFLEFLEYYSNFDYSQYAISVRTGSILPIEICRQAKSSKNDVRQWKELCIEEPFDLTNTARSVYDGETFGRIKAVFITSWKILQETMDLNALFSPLVSAALSQMSLKLTASIVTPTTTTIS